ncbi:unnamed protein product [Trifolium pratense]|uniref:Uncharacterized protein n=1 Tax=Trifolium pratense TaxID=57577 RepID=A0ACB0LWI7_TRIPR|nr:unnamed protein product [Trifolium pratense]
MPPRRAPAAPATEDDRVERMANSMNVMAAAINAQTTAKTQRDLEKREREVLAAGTRVLTSFSNQNPPKFTGEGGPAAADLWLQSVEKIMGAIHCPEEEMVTLATYQLRGDAEYWWGNASQLMEAAFEEFTWENFKRKFLAKYFPETARERYGEEFLKLVQGGLTVEAYAKKFESLSRFFRFFRDGIDEAYMCRRFQGGLRYELQDAVVPLGIRQFQVLVEKCQEIEDMRSKRANRQGGFVAGGPSRPSHHNSNRGGRGVKPYNRPQGNRGPPIAGNQGNQENPGRVKQSCYKCGEEGHYANNCGTKSLTCYNCQRQGHYAWECRAPRKEAPPANVAQGGRPTAKGRVYVMGAEGGEQAGNAIHEDCQIADDIHERGAVGHEDEFDLERS